MSGVIRFLSYYAAYYCATVCTSVRGDMERLLGDEDVENVVLLITLRTGLIASIDNTILFLNLSSMCYITVTKLLLL